MAYFKLRKILKLLCSYCAVAVFLDLHCNKMHFALLLITVIIIWDTPRKLLEQLSYLKNSIVTALNGNPFLYFRDAIALEK